MEGIIKSMTHARLMLMAAAVLVAGLVTAGVGVMGYSATRQENPAAPGQSRPEMLANRLRPRRSRRTRPVPLPRNRPRIKVPSSSRSEVVDPEGHRLVRGRCRVTVWYSRGSGDNRVGPRANQNRRRGPGPARGRSRTPGCEGLLRERLGVPTRACDLRRPTSCSREKRPPAVIHLTLDATGEMDHHGPRRG